MNNFEEFIDKIDKLIWKICNTYNVEGYHIDDLRQECLTKAFEVYKDFDGSNNLTTYIYPILKNHLNNLATETQTIKRKNYIGNDKKNKVLHNTTKLDLSRIIKQPTYTDYELYVIDTFYECLNNEPIQTTYIVEKWMRGLVFKEIGEELGVSKQRVNKVFNDFIKKVKEKINE